MTLYSLKSNSWQIPKRVLVLNHKEIINLLKQKLTQINRNLRKKELYLLLSYHHDQIWLKQLPADKRWIWSCIDYCPITTNEANNKDSQPSPCYLYYLYSYLMRETNLDNFSTLYFGYIGQFFSWWTIKNFHFIEYSPIVWISIIRTSWRTKLIFVSRSYISVH